MCNIVSTCNNNRWQPVLRRKQVVLTWTSSDVQKCCMLMLFFILEHPAFAIFGEKHINQVHHSRDLQAEIWHRFAFNIIESQGGNNQLFFAETPMEALRAVAPPGTLACFVKTTSTSVRWNLVFTAVRAGIGADPTGASASEVSWASIAKPRKMSVEGKVSEARCLKRCSIWDLNILKYTYVSFGHYRNNQYHHFLPISPLKISTFVQTLIFRFRFFSAQVILCLRNSKLQQSFASFLKHVFACCCKTFTWPCHFISFNVENS